MTPWEKRLRSGHVAEPSLPTPPVEPNAPPEAAPLPFPWEHVYRVMAFAYRIANGVGHGLVWSFVAILFGHWRISGAASPPPQEWAARATTNLVRAQERMRADLANPATRRKTVVAFWFAVASMGLLVWAVMHPM